ncbi:putative ribonuclease H-like domain-containing protein [Tanacetum coccineum]
MSANDNFSLHDDEELSLHDDASLNGSEPTSNKGDAPAKPPQIITTNTLSNIKLPVLQKIDSEGNSMSEITTVKDVYTGFFPPTSQEEKQVMTKEIWQPSRKGFGGKCASQENAKSCFETQFDGNLQSTYKESLEKGRRPRVDGKMHVAFDKRKVECFNCHNTGHFARECKFKSSKEGNRQEAGKSQNFKPVQIEKEALMTIDEGQINWVEQTTDEELNHALMAFTVFNGGYEEEMSRGIFVLRETDAGYNDIPLIQQIQTVSNASSIVFSYVLQMILMGTWELCQLIGSTHYSTCQSNVSDGRVENCKATILQNWNQRIERELGAGYSFVRKPCFVCGSLSHLIKDCDYYEKKMAREAALKSKRVIHVDARQARPAWTNSNRVNNSKNQFQMQTVQLSNIRPNFSTATRTIKTGRVNVNTGKQNVSSGSKHVNSGSVHFNSGTQFKSGRPKPVKAMGPKEKLNLFLVMLEFYREKGIKQEFSNARTPQQNRVAERMNRTLIEAARTMLAVYSYLTLFGQKELITCLLYINRDSKDVIDIVVQSEEDAGPNGEKGIGCSCFEHLGPVLLLVPTSTNPVNTDDDEMPEIRIYDKSSEARIEAIRLFLAFASFMGFIVYQMDVKSAFLYGTIDEEPIELGMLLVKFLENDGDTRGHQLNKTFYSVEETKRLIMLVQVYVDDIIFGSTNKSWCDEFEALMQSRFQMSSMGELTFFLGLQVKQNKEGIFISQDKYVAEILKKFDLVHVKAAITPMETKLPLTKDEEVIDGRCTLILIFDGFLMESPLDLEAFSDSDYGGSNLDRKSTTGGCQFLGQRLISWQCKKQTIVATSTTEAEYVAAANCCGQVLWVQNQLLDYGFNFMNTKIHIDNESTICIVKNPVYHSKTKHIEIRHHFIRDCYEKKLISVEKIHTDLNVADLLTKPFDGPRFNYLVVSIGFAEIVDFLRGSNLRYALTANPTIYDSLVKQFWQSAVASTREDGSLEISATVDTKRYIISEASIRDSLQLNDATGISMLPNDDLFEDSEDEEPEVQGRNSQADPQDSSKQGLVTPPTTKSHASGEEQEKELNPNTLEAAKTLSKINTATRRSDGENQCLREGKVLCSVKKLQRSTKEQISQEEARLAEAIRLDSHTKRRGGY